MDETRANTYVSVSQVDLTEAPANEVQQHVQLLMRIQDRYEVDLAGLFKQVSSGSGAGPEEVEDFARSILPEHPAALKKLDEIEEEARKQILKINWPTKGHIRAARNTFQRRLHSRDAGRKTKPGDISHLLEELI
jgi:hypothetical protein